MGKFIPRPQGSLKNIVVGTKRRGSGKQQNQRCEKKYRKQGQQYVAGLAKIGFHKQSITIRLMVPACPGLD
jgi:hypothetical protein